MAHVNRKIEIDWMLEQYRTSKHYKDHKAAYDADREVRQAIVRELEERKEEWNVGSIGARRKARDKLVKEIMERGDSE